MNTIFIIIYVMFNPILPNNNLEKLPKSNFNFSDIDLLKQLNKTNIAITKLNGVANSIPNQDILLEFISIKEGVKSNEIEAIHTTVGDAFMSELFEDLTEISKENKETINYKDAIYYGFKQIKDKGGISYNNIIEINKIITKTDAGIISSPTKKIEKQINGGPLETVYTPPVGLSLISALLYNLEEYYNNFNEAEEIDPLLKLPILHYQLEAIHPFGDGNGRTGRILMVLYFVLYKKLDLPILFLSDFIIQDKSNYYNFLRNIDSGKDLAIKEFTIWLLLGIEEQAVKTNILILDIKILMADMKLALKSDKELLKIYSKELLDFLFIRPFYSISKLEKYLSIHKNTAGKYLNLLEKKGFLESIIIKRKKIFYFKKFLDVLE